MLRQATRADIPAMHRVRLSVRENRLSRSAISESDYVTAIESTGRGWVIESEGEIVAFAVGNATTGNIWALFVDPQHEGLGFGRQLHDSMVAWLWSQHLEMLWLTTAQRTRAARFYEAAGWRSAGLTPDGDLRYELSKSMMLMAM
jgi:GNAT superfamily N-acetyltransferase